MGTPAVWPPVTWNDRLHDGRVHTGSWSVRCGWRMIKGIGTDIVEVDRLERATQLHGRAFLARLFTATEMEYCEGQWRRFESYAARFAAKEAFLKALGSGGRDGISWQDLDVVRDSLGRPDMVVKGNALLAARRLGVDRVFLALSHTSGMATAAIVLEGIEERDHDEDREDKPGRGQHRLVP
jgi:holo-[acyl-carrier protein] synthase